MLRYTREFVVAMLLQALMVTPSGLDVGPGTGRRGPFLHDAARHPRCRLSGLVACPGDGVSGLVFAVPGPGHPGEAACPGPSINCRRRFRTVDRINKRQVYRGYRVTEVVKSFPEHSNNPIPHKAYHHCAARMNKILYWKLTT
jgi:hypothetical protein